MFFGYVAWDWRDSQHPTVPWENVVSDIQNGEVMPTFEAEFVGFAKRGEDGRPVIPNVSGTW